MGKSEILMLLAGVALSIMLAMVAIPMFSSGKDMADKQEVQQELMAIKSSIPIIIALEGEIDAKKITTHMKGFVDGEADSVKGKSKGLANFKIEDKATDKKVIVTVKPTAAGSGIKLDELSKLSDICDGDNAAEDGLKAKAPGSLKCYINR